MRYVGILWRKLKRIREEGGQAAVEYAVMSTYMLLAVAGATPVLMKFAPEMLDALQIYVDGFYFVFSLPIP